ncbi:MAG: hypothetical protein AAF805_14820, partial [Planctomycetota bacterium]
PSGNAWRPRNIALDGRVARSPRKISPMMRPDLIESLHRSPAQGVLAIAGGGAAAIGRLLETPGASATVLEAVVPYAAASLCDWLGDEPRGACSAETARSMAVRAWERARQLAATHAERRSLFGLGATAALATNRQRRGANRAHVAAHSAERTLLVSLDLAKGRRSRGEEEAIVSHTIVAAVATIAGVHSLDLSKTPPGVEATVRDQPADPAWADLLLGDRSVVPLNGAPSPGDGSVCLLPGSFNPPHEGHDAIARIAAERTGRPIAYEVSIENVDKPSLDHLAIAERVAALGDRPAWLTRSPRFIDKARLAPGACFAIGADTAARLGDARYAADDRTQRDAEFAEIARLGGRFLVFGRRFNGRFHELGDLDLPPGLRELCEAVPEEAFRHDVSSTELRAMRGD